MRRIGWIAVFLRVPLCAALALVFLATTLAQPGVHAMAKASAIASAAENAHAMHGASKVASTHDGENRQHAHKAGGTAGDGSDRICDIQCAPVSVMPVDCFGLGGGIARCYAITDFVKLADSEPLGLIRPPRSLV